jgi:hypothetical protein
VAVLVCTRMLVKACELTHPQAISDTRNGHCHILHVLRGLRRSCLLAYLGGILLDLVRLDDAKANTVSTLPSGFRTPGELISDSFSDT